MLMLKDRNNSSLSAVFDQLYKKCRETDCSSKVFAQLYDSKKLE